MARLIETLSQPYAIDGIEVTIGASVGVALFPADGANADELIKNADLALYQAKSEGRRRHRFFQQDLQRAAQERRTLETDLRGALAEGQLEVHYQPLVDICGRRVTGFEALLRWRHPTRGMIAPNDFIPIAEESGLIVPIGEWVLRTACAEAANWPSDVSVAVNLSAIQFRARQSVPDGGGRARPLRPRRRAAWSSRSPRPCCSPKPTRPSRRCTRCATSACAIALDDFGTGYSSSELPAQLPLRQDQDRPLFRQRPRRARRLHGDHFSDLQPRPQPRHRHHGGGRRDGGAARLPARARVHAGPGLPVQPSAAARGPRRADRAPQRPRRCGGVRPSEEAASA